MSRPVIVSALRSPFTPAGKGELRKTRPDDLAAVVARALVARSGVSPQDIDDVIAGCAFPEGEQGFNLGRMVALLSGLPDSVPGVTVNRWCGSSLEAVQIAAAKIHAGQGQAFLCVGVESMTRIPMGGFSPAPNPALFAALPHAYDAMGKTAETLAQRYNISRAAQEDYALASHQKAANSDMTDEIIAVPGKEGPITRDGCIRTDASLERMRALPPAFDAQGSVTAATSSPLTDGAAGVLVCDEDYARAKGLPMLASIRASAVVGVPPETMGIGAAVAAQKALARAGLTLADMEVIEINEAFAAQTLACLQILGLSPDAVNREGGAIALGHPLGASGARVVGKAARLLHRTGGRYALATLCIGGGQGIATVLERL